MLRFGRSTLSLSALVAFLANAAYSIPHLRRHPLGASAFFIFEASLAGFGVAAVADGHTFPSPPPRLSR